MLLNFIAFFWNALGAPARRALLWVFHAKFLHGVSGIILDAERRKVLLLKHRFWHGQQWGFPGGLASGNESIGETVRRELREEINLDARPVSLLLMRTRGSLGEFFVLCEWSGEPRVQSFEIMEARFWDLSGLPANMLSGHREALNEIMASGNWSGLPIGK